MLQEGKKIVSLCSILFLQQIKIETIKIKKFSRVRERAASTVADVYFKNEQSKMQRAKTIFRSTAIFTEWIFEN